MLTIKLGLLVIPTSDRMNATNARACWTKTASPCQCVPKCCVDQGKEGEHNIDFMKPFTWNVWYATLATIVVSSFIYQWLEYMNSERDERSFRKWLEDKPHMDVSQHTRMTTNCRPWQKNVIESIQPCRKSDIDAIPTSYVGWISNILRSRYRVDVGLTQFRYQKINICYADVEVPFLYSNDIAITASNRCIARCRYAVMLLCRY